MSDEEEIQLVNSVDEIDMIMEQLIAVWGHVFIDCNGKTCTVTEIGRDRVFEAPTLLEALRLAAKEIDPL